MTALRKLLIALIFCASMVAPAAFAAPVPVPGDAPVAVERLRPNNPAVIPMTGTWRFKLEHGTSPAVRGELPATAPLPSFATLAAADADWKDIPVPANWEVEGFSIPTYQERAGNPSDDIGLYRRWIDVPASFAGQKVLWHFDGVYDGAEVFVNGQRCGYHESGFTAFDINVTKALKPGERNLMAVRVYKKTSSGALDKGDFWCLGGICRETYLVALPALHVEDVTVITDLDAQYKDATLKSTVRVAGPAGAHFVLTGELYSFEGKVAITRTRQDGEIGADGSVTVSLTTPVAAPKLWSAEKPNLYYVFYSLTDGNQIVERVQDRIGFRKVEFKNGVVLVNGVPVKFTGVCRHEEFSPYGHALTEECWKADIALLKAANVSAIRTAHYNHAARFMELCDEAGFYVLDEIPSCWISNEVRDASRTWAYVFRSKETLDRDKNRACVVAWSCGNESGYGVNNQAEFDYMKAHDPTRLAFISQQNLDKNPKSDFDDYHYPPVPNIKAMITNRDRAKVPAVYTEIGGIEDPWGQILNDNWAPIWSSDGITGAFIWEWQEQNLADRFSDRWSIRSPGGKGFDAATHMRLAGGGGAVTADRQPKPNRYWNLKIVYSPVMIAAREIDPAAGQCVVPIQNRYSFTDLAELTCRWQALAGEKELAHGESRVAAKPRSSVNAAFPATPGMDTLRLEFIHPDGRSVYATRLYVKGYQGPAAPVALAAAGPVRFSETDQNVVVEAAGTRLAFDKRIAQVTSWRAGDQDLVVGGPILNLGESANTTIGRVGSSGPARGPVTLSSTQPPQCRNAVVTAKMDGANAEIAVTADVYLAGSEEAKGQLAYQIEISPDGQADFTWKLDWKAADATAREAGMKFLLPAKFDRMSWYSHSLWTEYPADHIANPHGSASSKDLAFSSFRREVQWLSLTGAGNYGLVALSAGSPLHTHGRVDNNGVMLFLSSGIASTGRDVTGDDIRLTKSKALTGGFRLRAAKTN